MFETDGFLEPPPSFGFSAASVRLAYCSMLGVFRSTTRRFFLSVFFSTDGGTTSTTGTASCCEIFATEFEICVFFILSSATLTRLNRCIIEDFCSCC